MGADYDQWTPAFQLMLEEARRSIDRQSDRLQHVRQRAVGLVGFGSIVAAALGLGNEPKLGAAGVVAILAFVVVVAAALFVLVPREFQFELSAHRMQKWVHDPKQRWGVGQMVWSTAALHDQHHTYNHGKLRRLQAAIAIGVAALFVESLALVARLVL